MGKFEIGSVISVLFPFSNLTGQKVRPALVLASVEFDNYILCQITSKPYSSKTAILISEKDFVSGNLSVISYVRPDKLFTADTAIIKNTLGQLNSNTRTTILRNVRRLFAS